MDYVDCLKKLDKYIIYFFHPIWYYFFELGIAELFFFFLTAAGITTRQLKA